MSATPTPKPEERNLPEIVKVFKANINSPRGQWPANPDFFLTKGEMTYVVEVLEQHLGEARAVHVEGK